MKKLNIYTIFFLASLLLISIGKSYAQTISVSGVPVALCANESFSIDFTASGFVPTTGNIYQAQLSNSAGSFASPTVISNESFSTALTGSIYATIPYNTTFGSGYRIRVVSTNPSVIGTNNGANIGINCLTRDYYWLGGSGSWSDLSHWEYTVDGVIFETNPAEPPRPEDNANFDANSFPSGGMVRFDQDVDINDFYWEPGSGATNPAIESDYYFLTLKGELVLDAGVISHFGDIEFNSTKVGIEINYGDNLLSNNFPGGVRFYGGGSWELNSSMTAGYMWINDGSIFSTNDFELNLNGQLWASGSFNTLNTGTSEIYLNDLTSNDMLITGSATWHLADNNGSLRNFGRNVNVNKVIIESGKYRLDGTNTLNELILMPGSGIQIPSSTIQTVLTNMNAVGTRAEMVTIEATSPGTPGTLDIGGGGTVTADFITIQDNTITTTTTPFTYTADNSIDKGGNTNWVFNQLTPLDYYWVGGSGNWSDNLAHWGKLPGGGGFRASPPGALDNIFFTSSSFPSGGTITIDKKVECNDMTWEPGSGTTNPKIYADYNNTLIVHGDFKMDNGVNRSVERLIFDFATGETHDIIFADNVFDFNRITVQGGGTADLGSQLAANTLNLDDGIFNSNNFQVDLEELNLNGTNESNWGSSTVNISNRMYNLSGSITFNAGTSSFYFKPKYDYWDVYMSGPFVLYDAEFSGSTIIQGDNFFNNLTFMPGADISLSTSTTQSIAGGTLSATGTRDQPIRIHSNSTGNQANISQSAGTVNTEYLILEDNNVSGGATFNTANYTIIGNVTGWTLGSPLDTFDFYWVGGTGEWSDFANHWSQADGDLVNLYAFAPGPSDNVIFTSNSFTAAGQVVTLPNAVELANMTWQAGSGSNSPSIFADWNNTLTIHGNLAFANGVQRDIRDIDFDSPNSGNTIDFADNQGGVSNNQLRFKGGGEWNLQSRIEVNYINVENATINTLDNEIKTYALSINDPLSVVNLGASEVYTNQIYDWSGAGILNAGTSTIIISENFSSFYGNFSLSMVNVLNGGAIRVDQDMSVNNLNLAPGSTLEIQQGVTLTTSSMSATGTSGNPIRIKSSTQGNQGFISQASGSVNANFLLISDNDASGGASFSASNSINAGNTTGWILTAPVTNNYYWVGGTGDWSDATNHWADADGGSNFYSTPPGIADNVFFTESSFTGPDEKVVIDQNAFCHNMGWTTSVALSPTLFGTFDIPLKVFGSFILADGVQRNVSELIFETFTTGNTINMADNIRGSFAQISLRGTGEWTLASDFEAESVEFEGGTFNTSNFDLRVDDWSFSNSEAMTFNAGSSNIYTSRFNNYTWNNNLTFNNGTSTVHIIDTQESSNSINGPLNFNNLIIETDARIWGSNSFSSFTVNNGVSLALSSFDVQLISSLSLNGTSPSPIIINSTQAGEQGTFSVPSNGTVSADYVILTDNNATGGANFTATNSSELGNVTGWTGLLPGQLISFPPLDDILSSEQLTLSASVSSGLNITYTVQPITGNGNISTDTFTPSSVGLVGIVANQPGDGVSYAAAQAATQYVHVNLGDLPNELGQMKQASYVVGAPNGVSEGDWNPTDKSLPQVTQAIVSTDGKLIAAGMGRVMIWNQLPDAYDVPADVVVGQPSFTSFSFTASRTTLAAPNEIFTGGVAIGPAGQLIVSDGRGVLIWNTIPTTNGAPADVIIGQTNFTATNMAPAQDKFLSPLGVAVSSTGKLIVSDITGHRVLIFNSIPTANGASADVVIGQPDFTSNAPGISQFDLAFPGFVSVTPDDKLLIADITNNRVLVYNSIPTTNYAGADAVLGQADFNSNAAATTATSLRFPMCATVSGTGKLAISDWENNRVLIYNQLPTSSSTSPDLVIGQPDFTTKGIDYDNISLRVIAAPFGVFWDMTDNLLITDSGFGGLSRVMVYGAKDLEPPVIQSINHLSPYYTLGGTNQTSIAFATDRSGIQSATAYWQEVSSFNPASPAYEQEPLTYLGGDQFQFDVSIVEAKGPNPIGIEYYVEFIDNAGNSVNNINNKQVLPVHYPNGTSLNTYGVGSTTEAYRLIAVPIELDNGAVENVFSSIYGGTFDKSEMRIFSYAGGTATGYNEAAASTNLSVGKGYFALAKTGSPGSVILPAGTTSFSSTNTAGQNVHEFTINLVNGWNLIGNPFNRPVKWVDIETLSGITTGEVDNLQNYGSGGYDATITSIPVGGGAFVLNNTGSSFTLRIPALETPGGRVSSLQENKNPLSESSWEVLFKTLGNDNQEIILGGVGMEEEAEYSKDMYDRVNPPAFGSIKLIEFAHPEYIAPSFKVDIRESADQEKWSFEYIVLDPENNKHRIHWDNSYFGENAPDLYLVDKTHFTVVNMKEKSSYTFSHAGLTKFEVYYGNNSLNELLPDKLDVQTPYPNPFNKEVTFNIGLPSADNEYKVIVGIYDTMGKQVTTLLNGNMDAGYYSFSWQGESKLGNLVPKGIYAYRVVITGKTNKVVTGKIIKN